LLVEWPDRKKLREKPHGKTHSVSLGKLKFPGEMMFRCDAAPVAGVGGVV